MRNLRLEAIIERRLLINYRADPYVVARLLPATFRPRLRHGYAIAGICLQRLGRTRPAGLPAGIGFGSENASHRFAVEWDSPDGPRTGVYVLSRDTASRLRVAAGGRLFPGVQRRADFDVAERPDRLRVAYASSDGSTAVDVEVRIAEDLAGSSLFGDVQQAAEFFPVGVSGYSAGRDADQFEGTQLPTLRSRIDPCVVDRSASSYYDDRSVFPAGSIELDSALLIRKVPARFNALAPLRAHLAAVVSRSG